jgi:hypothetical protein
MKESGYGKESGNNVAVNEYLITKTGTLCRVVARYYSVITSHFFN